MVVNSHPRERDAYAATDQGLLLADRLVPNDAPHDLRRRHAVQFLAHDPTGVAQKGASVAPTRARAYRHGHSRRSRFANDPVGPSWRGCAERSARGIQHALAIGPDLPGCSRGALNPG